MAKLAVDKASKEHALSKEEKKQINIDLLVKFLESEPPSLSLVGERYVVLVRRKSNHQVYLFCNPTYLRIVESVVTHFPPHLLFGDELHVVIGTMTFTDENIGGPIFHEYDTFKNGKDRKPFPLLLKQLLDWESSHNEKVKRK